MSVFKAASVVGLTTLISRVFGYVRDIFAAMLLGAGPAADAFFVAFRIPNLLRQITSEGALLNAFVPLYTKRRGEADDAEADAFAMRALGKLLLILIPAAALGVLFMPQILGLLAGGLRQHPDYFAQAVTYGRISFPYIIFVSALSLYGGMLNARGRFFPFAFAPVIVNLCMIAAALLALYLKPEAPGLYLISALLPAGVFQVLWIARRARKAGAFVLPSFAPACGTVKTLGKRMIPGIIGGGVVQLNMQINTLIATYFTGAVSSLYYADRLIQLPLALIGTAAGIALLPALSRHTAEGRKDDAERLMRKAQEAGLLLALPAAFGLAALAEEIISVLFVRGAFTPGDAQAVVPLLQILCIGLPGLVLARMYAPCFYAAGDTKTPVKISFTCLFINIAVTLSAIPFIGPLALAAGPAFTGWCNALLLAVLLRKKDLPSVSVRRAAYAPFLLTAAGLCGCGAYVTARISSAWPEALSLGAAIAAGGVIYAAALCMLPRYRPSRLKRMLRS